MSYDIQKKTAGRQPMVVVEIHVDVCSLVYGTSPCTASIPTTGTQRCFNTKKTCQDTPNYAVSTKIYRFTQPHPLLPIVANLYPCLESVSATPTKLQLDSIATRATVDVKLRDFPHHDRGVDPYVSTRSYDPETTGTFWGKFVARNPYIVNRKLVVKSGYIDPSNLDETFTTDFVSKTYFIEAITPPDRNGMISIKAKDALKFAEDKKAKIPIPTSHALNANINNSTTTITLDSDAASFATGTLIVRINDELISYTGVSGSQLTGCTRGAFGTTADSHSAEDKVQKCVRYEDDSVPDVIEDILVNYANIDPSFIPKADWDFEAGIWMTAYIVNRIISEPIGVQELLKDFLTAVQAFLWWDEEAQEIKFKPIAPQTPGNPITTWTDDNILQKSMKFKFRPEDRLSDVSYYYDLRSNISDTQQPANYFRGYRKIDIDAEDVSEYGKPSFLLINSPYITSLPNVREITDRLLKRRRDVLLEVSFDVDTKDSAVIVGDYVDLITRFIQGGTGEPETKRYVVIERREIQQGSQFGYTLLELNFTNKRYGLISDNAMVNYTSATETQQNKYAFISSNAGLMSNGDQGYVII